MKKYPVLSLVALTIPLMPLFAALYGDVPDARHAWSVHDWNRPKPVKVEPSSKIGGAPSDAIVLFDGTRESLLNNWISSDGTPVKWLIGKDGDFYCDPGWKFGEIRTRAEFGDCQLHIEFRHDPAKLYTDKGPQMRGNSGVFLMGNYEIQVLESYGTSKDGMTVDNYTDGQAGSVYAENPPMVNPARKPGEWQVFDIVFHQPVWENGKMLHPGSVTVFFNGVLVQDHWEMEGLTTHCVRRPLSPHPDKGPLKLQDHGCNVHFRNIWYRPIPSRWSNKTHSLMSADEKEVMALRRKTASRLFAKIDDPAAAGSPTLLALAEVVSYAYESPYAEAFKASLDAYRANPGGKADIEKVNRELSVLVRCGVIPRDFLVR